MNIAVGILLGIIGFGMIGFWVIYTIRGGLPHGIKTLENEGYLAFHVSAEILTGILCLVSGIMLILNHRYDHFISLIATGMLLYTSINSLAWKEVKNKPLTAVMFIVPALIAVFSIIYLLVST